LDVLIDELNETFTSNSISNEVNADHVVNVLFGEISTMLDN